MEDNNGNDRSSKAPAEDKKKKRKASKDLSPEERTPKRLKSVEPDVTVVVGGVEFYHYKTILCNSCEFFDTMLSANMREAKDSRIEFPDKKPEEWMMVYKFLDPTEWNDKEPRSSLVTPENALNLLPWFDFIGLEDLTKICDEVAASSLISNEMIGLNYKRWVKYRDLPCPRYQKVIKRVLKRLIAQFLDVAVWETREKFVPVLKKFLLDDRCGDEIWEYLLRKVKFSDKMLEQLDRQTIVTSPLFPFLLENSKK